MKNKLSNDELLNQIRSKAKQEQHLTLEIIELIQEVSVRRLFLPLGFSSLFDFVTKDLGYEPSSAMRRIQAARAITEIPEIKNKIEDGRLSLSVVSQVQSFFKKEENLKGKKLSQLQKVAIFTIVENKSTREAEKELAKLSPEAIKKTESVREISEDLTELKITIDSELKQQLDELKYLLSHQNPNLTYLELIRLMVIKLRKSHSKNRKKTSELSPALKRNDQTHLHRITTPVPNALPAPVVATRYVPAPIRRYIWDRDKGCCQYKDPNSGRVCQSKYQIQIDHIHRFRDGGEHQPENLRLLCRAHNHWRG